MTIEVKIPDDVFTTLRKSPAEVARDLRIAAAGLRPLRRRLEKK